MSIKQSMAPLVSVIVPTRNNSRSLTACLQSIADQDYPAVELVVVDNDSSDDTKVIANDFTKKTYDKGPERSAQRNFGVAKSAGEYVFIIDSDMQLAPDVVSACVAAVQASPETIALIIPEESFGVGFWAGCKKLERSYYIGVDWMEAARFFRREDYVKVGGYDEAMTGAEDYDLPQRLKERYGAQAIGRVKAMIYHDEGKLSLIRTCRKKFYYAQRLDSYKTKAANLTAYKQQASLLSRYRLFFSDLRPMRQHPLQFLGMLTIKTSEYAAGGLGYAWSKLRRPSPAK